MNPRHIVCWARWMPSCQEPASRSPHVPCRAGVICCASRITSFNTEQGAPLSVRSLRSWSSSKPNAARCARQPRCPARHPHAHAPRQVRVHMASPARPLVGWRPGMRRITSFRFFFCPRSVGFRDLAGGQGQRFWADRRPGDRACDRQGNLVYA
jgi:hypothetical protein